MTTWHPRKDHFARLSALLSDPEHWRGLLDPEEPVPSEMTDWLARLRLLYGLPFHYLVPDERMLPTESIRFFYLDPNWQDALLDGAMSIGRTTTKDASHDAAVKELVAEKAAAAAGKVRPTFDRTPEPPTDAHTTWSGFLLRSAVVSGWPGLEVEAYADAKRQQPLGMLRFERLAPTVLLCIFNGVLQLLDIHEPSEGIQFGAIYQPNHPAGQQYTMDQVRGLGYGGQKSPAAGEPKPVADYTVKMRDGAPRVLEIASLASSLPSELSGAGIQSPTPLTVSQLAVELVQSPERQTFENTPATVAPTARGASAGRPKPSETLAEARERLHGHLFGKDEAMSNDEQATKVWRTTSETSAFQDPHVLVPIVVDALPVNKFGNFPENDPKPHWANLTPHFDDIVNGQVLGEQITPGTFESTAGPGTGMHLHWALPDGLTHGVPPTENAEAKAVCTKGGVSSVTVTSGGEGYTSPPVVSFVGGGGAGASAIAQVERGKVTAIEMVDRGSYAGTPHVVLQGTEYPLVPNRWLVVRIHNDESQPSASLTAWVVESDTTFALDDGMTDAATSWPAGEGQWGAIAKYIGRSDPYPSWQAAAGTEGAYLTAIGPGDPAFAAYHPSCRSVFGFHDDLSDLNHLFPPEGTTEAIELTYCVTGWYSDPGADPLSCDTPAEWVDRTDRLRWSVAPPYPVATADRSTSAFSIEGFGDLSEQFPDGAAFDVIASRGNDGAYTVVSTHYTPATPAGTPPSASHESVFSITVDALPIAPGLVGLRAVGEGVIAPPGTVYPKQTLCHGMVYQAQWKGPEGMVVPDVPAGVPDLAIGNSSGEALAALVADKLSLNFPITKADPQSRTFVAASTSDASQDLPAGAGFFVTGSCGNDGSYTVAQSSYADGFVTIVVEQEIASSVTDGEISLPVAKVLEALLHHLLSEFDPPNGLVTLEEELHSRAFRRQPGGVWWDIGRTQPDGNVRSPRPPLPPLTEKLGQDLSQLNNQQQECDRLERDIVRMQQEAYFAWYKRTQKELQEAPNPKKKDIEPLTELTEAIVKQVDELVRDELAPARQKLESDWATLHGELPQGYQLEARGMPRFWQANDPVLLIAGDAVGRAFKHGEDGRFSPEGTLACRITGETVRGLSVTPPGKATVTVTEKQLAPYYGAFPSGKPIPADIVPLFVEAFLLDPTQAPLIARAAWVLAGVAAPTAEQVAELAETVKTTQTAPFAAALWGPTPRWVAKQLAAAGGLEGEVPSKIAVAKWAWPWTPLFFEWGATWYPSYGSEDMTKPDWGLFEDWQLTPGGNAISEVDYTWTSKQGATQHAHTGITGTVVITPQAAVNLADRLTQYLANQPDDSPYKDVLQQAIGSVKNLPILSQALSGLESALVMQRKALQLPLIPLGLLPEDDALASDVSRAIDHRDATAPIAAPGFFPVRAGHLKIDKLWLVDGFGQIKPVPGHDEAPTPILPEELRTPGESASSGIVQLPPRLTQAARLSFRLMSGTDLTSQVETNAVPSTSPLCGWLLPNHLDNSLMVYDPDGQALGELELLDGSFGSGENGVRWAPAPGRPAVVGGPPRFDPRLAHVQDFLTALIELGAEGHNALADLMPIVDESLWSVDPLGARKNQTLSVLVGRPLALVRARLALELDGLPAYDESEKATGARAGATDQGGVSFDDHGFTKIPFPVHLGDIRDIQDGLIGYFVDDDYRTFYAVHGAEGTRAATRLVSSYVQFGHFVDLSADPAASPTSLTLLVDPRATVHATSGILPVKSIEVPPDTIAKALAAMDVTFITGPIISNEDKIAVPLPAFQQGTWSWVDQPGVTTWETRDEIGKVSVGTTLGTEPHRIYEGWLKLSDALGRSGTGKSGTGKDGDA